ncbi:EamA family transporter [Roseateles oligotrophus]|uniref:EamA family transporter n=1 Tax=Roseateles oligotrophus TaxID=1769250 RepID=A0ABT2YDW8_9BURK|nr:EamA family transporter [Roseateles oligotrophus]MCV2368224.1 EamA family transporter [Roseateles oligotrophus]
MKAIELALALLVTAIWGLNFSIVKLGLGSMDPFLLAALRFALCALPAVFFVPRPAVHWGYLAIYGLFFGVLQWGLVYAGIYFGLSAGLASVVLQLAVFFSMAGGIMFFREKLAAPLIAGTTLAFAGVALIAWHTEGRGSLLGLSLVLLGALAWAFANVTVKKSGTKSSQMFGFIVWASLAAPLPLLLLSWLFSGPEKIVLSLASIDRMALFSIAFQVYPTTLFGYAIWNHLLRKYPVSSVAPLALLVPVFGMLSAMLIFDEALPAYKLAALLLILTGLIVNGFGGKAWQAARLGFRRA